MKTNKKKKKKPIVSTSMKSLRKAREVTSAFHELTTAVQVMRGAPLSIHLLVLVVH